MESDTRTPEEILLELGQQAPVGPSLTEAKPSLADRFRVNQDVSFYSGTLTGAIRGAGSDAFEKQKALERYESFSQWETPMEGAVALAGQLAGAAMSFENYIGLGLGARAVGWAGIKAPPIVARFAGGAVDAGVTNAVTDTAIQGIEIGHGQRESFAPGELAASVGLGAVIGGVAGSLLGRAVPSALPESPKLTEAAGGPSLARETATPEPAPQPSLPIGESLDIRARERRGLGPSTLTRGDPDFLPVDDLLAAPAGREPTALDHPVPEAARQMAPVEITGSESGSDMLSAPLKTALIGMRDWARTNIAGKEVVNAADGTTIQIPYQGIKHSLRGNMTRDALAATAKLDTILREGVPSASLPDNQGRANIKAFHYYDAQAQIAERRTIIRAVVREMADGRRYYDHFERLPDRSPAPGNGPGNASPQVTSGAPKTSAGKGTIGDGGGEGNLAAVASALRAGALERTQQGVAQASLPETPAFTRVKEIGESLAKALDATAVRQGRLAVKAGRGMKAGGQYAPKSGVIRLAKPDDFDVLSHELGHHLEEAIGKPLKGLMAAHEAELNPLAYQGHKKGTTTKEGFAEFVRTYVTNPAYAKAKAPQFFQAFEAFMAKQGHGEMLAALKDAGQAWRQWLDQPSSEAVASTIVSGAEPKYFARTRRELARHGLAGTIAEKLSRSYTMLFDELNPIAKAVQGLLDIHHANSGKAIDLRVFEDPYKLARLSRGAFNQGHTDVSFGVHPYRGTAPKGPALRDALIVALGKPNVLSHWDDELIRRFGAYLWSRRAMGEWERFDQGLIPNPPDKLTRGDHVLNIAEMEKAFPQFSAAAPMVHEWALNLWAKKRDAGLITHEQWKEGLKIKDYVPGLRAFDQEGDAVGRGGRTGEAKSGFVKRFRGSRRDVVNPVESLIADAYETAMAIARNDVVKQLDRLAGQAGRGAGRIAERIPSHEIKATMIDPLEVVERAASQAGMAKPDAMALRDAFEAQIGSDKMAIFRPAIINEKGEAIAFFRDGGELRALRLADGDFGRDMYKALTNMTGHEKNVFIELLAKPASALRLGITSAPEFIIANFIRDQTMAWVYYGQPLKRLAATVKGTGDEIFGRDAARAYNSAGGIMGGATVADAFDLHLRSDIHSLEKKGWVVQRFSSLKGFLELSELSETGMRLGLFKTFFDEAKGRGLDAIEAQFEAAYRARDHLDFNRRGSAMTGLARLIPFLNASLQGTEKTYRQMLAPLFREALSEADVKARADALKSWTRVGAATVATMGLAALMSQHDEYQDLSPQTKATHWMFKSGGKWAAIPKPFELSAVLNLGEAAWAAIGRRDPRWAEQYLASLYEATMPPNVMEGNPLIATSYELATGVSLRDGQPIVPEELKGMEPFLQYSARTSEFSKLLGKAINEPPAVIDHLITGFGGSMGRNALALYDYALSDKPTQGWEDFAITRRFIKDGSRGALSNRAFWDLVGTRTGALEGARKTWAALIEGGDTARADDFLAAQDEVTRVWIAAGSVKAGLRRIHPLLRAQHAVTAINGLRREMAGDVLKTAEGTVTVGRVDRGAADDILEELAMVEARNALVTMKAPGFATRQVKETAGYFRELDAISPDLARALADRFATAKVLPLDTVEKLWPEFEARLKRDGSAMRGSDLLARAKAAGFEMAGKAIKRKPRPEVPALNP